MQWFILIVTVLILAAIGQAVTNLHNSGNWWVWVAFPLLIAVGIYRLGEDEDRAYFHRAWRRLTYWMTK